MKPTTIYYYSLLRVVVVAHTFLRPLSTLIAPTKKPSREIIHHSIATAKWLQLNRPWSSFGWDIFYKLLLGKLLSNAEAVFNRWEYWVLFWKSFFFLIIECERLGWAGGHLRVFPKDGDNFGVLPGSSDIPWHWTWVMREARSVGRSEKYISYNLDLPNHCVF